MSGAWLLAAASALLALACAEPSSTTRGQVFVIVQLDEGIRPQLSDINIDVIETRDAAVTDSHTFVLGDGLMTPFSFAVRQAAGGAQDFRLSASGNDALGQTIINTTLGIVFVPGGTTFASVRLSASCLNKWCGIDESCYDAGVCEPIQWWDGTDGARFDAGTLPPSPCGDAGPSPAPGGGVSFCPTTDAGLLGTSLR